MAKQIKGSDIIEPRHLEEAVQQAVNLKNAYLLLDKQVKATSATLKATTKTATGGNVGEIRLITEAYKESNIQKKAAIKITEELKLAEDNEVKAKIRLQQATATQKKLLTEEIALENKQLGTLQKLAIENTRLRREREGLNLETKKGSERLKEINIQLDKNNKLIDASSDKLKKQKLNVGNYQSAVGKLTGVLGQLGLAFSAFTAVRDAFKTVVDFEKATASLSAITGATGNDLTVLKGKVMELSETMKISATDATKLFEIVGSQMPQLLKDAEGLKNVAESAVILSKASGDSVEESTLALANVMNQFSLGADQAERAMNILAAGSLVGSAGIADVSESMKNFGSVAAGANISVEESVALIEVLGKYGVTGAESGTKLRGSILKLQQASFGYASGQFEVNDALDEAKKKMDSFNTALEQDAFLQETFGAENISTGRILLGNIKLFEEYTQGVTGTNVATEQAETNSQTMSVVIKELGAAYDNLIIKWSEGTDVLGGLKTTLKFVTDNLETIITVVVKAVTAWGSYRVGLMLVNKEGTGLIQVLGNMIKALPQATSSIKSFGMALKSVGFAGWLSILTVVIPMLWDMGKAIYNAFNEVTALDRVTEKLNKRMDEEKAKMDVLLVQINATNAGSKERQVLIDQINSTYGTTLQNLSDETAFMNQLAESYEKVVSQMEKKINAQLIEEELTEAFKAKREAESQLEDIGDRDRFNVYEFEIYTNLLNKANSEISELQKELFSLNSQLNKSGKSLGDDISPRMRMFTAEAKDAGKGVKDLREDVDRLVKSTQGFTDAELKSWRELIDLLGGGVQGDEFDPTGPGLWESIAQLGIKLTDDLQKKEQEAFEQRKKMAQDSIDLMKKVTEALIAEYDARIAKEREVLAEQQGSVDYLREQAKMGNTDAAESLKAEQIAIAKQKLEIEALEKKRRNLLVITTGLEAVSQKINAGDSNAFSNVSSELANFIAKLPKFYTGTETTVAEALGSPHLSGKDGYISRLDGSEMVLNGKKTSALQSAGLKTTTDITNAALAYSSSMTQQKPTQFISSASEIVSELKSVKEAIKNIPQHDFRWDDVNKMAVHTVKTGNKTVVNHQKTGGLFS